MTTDKVTSGSRPEWPSNNQLQQLVDELWEQIVAYWNQEPNGRPTVFKVLQTLRVLGEAQHQEPVISVEDSDDEATMGEWEQVKDTPDGMFVLAALAWSLTLVGLQFPRHVRIMRNTTTPTADLVVHAGAVYSGICSARSLRNACPAPRARRSTYWERRLRQLEPLS